MTGIELITAERDRQVNEEGWDLTHDDSINVKGELAQAAACYIIGQNVDWPWDQEWYKPSGDRIRDLVKAGALIAAEIDRLIRRTTKCTWALALHEQLQLITFTGVDDQTDINELSRISKQARHEFGLVIEWGVLVSVNDGRPRYPSRSVIREMAGRAGEDFRVAFHFCGEAFRDLLPEMVCSADLDRPGIRVQLNIAESRIDKADVDDLPPAKYIFQCSDVATSSYAAYRRYIMRGNANLLFDSSGGRGKLPLRWPEPRSSAAHGYAGGLNPENIEEQLLEIFAVLGVSKFWIDIESGVRNTDEFGADVFDLRKVWDVISKVGALVEQSREKSRGDGRQGELNLDVSADEARALHRVVRAMHDGHCPACGHLDSAVRFRKGVDHCCPSCGFGITKSEAEAALASFQPYLRRSLAVFEEWRSGISGDG